MNPFLSIIIPTLNEEKYLPFLLSSLTNQTFQDFEVIVVDGVSTDETVRVAKRFSNRLNLRVKTIKIANVAMQRNSGAASALGKYFVFFDADACLPPDFLSEICEHLYAQSPRILTTFIRPPDRDVKKQIITTITNLGIKVANIIQKPMVAGYNIVIEKKLFLEIGGFNPELSLSEDHDLVRRCHDIGERLIILHHPKQIFSFRRFEKYGYWQTVQLYTFATMNVMLKGPKHDIKIPYPMGGDQYENPSLYMDE